MTDPGADPLAPSPPDRRSRAPAAARQAPTPVSLVCPFLRAEDGGWRSSSPSRAHRCAATQPPVPLATAKQRSLCLVAAHESCATFVAARELTGAGGMTAGPEAAGLWPETRSTPIALEPAHPVLAPLAGGPARTGGQALLVGLMVLAFIVLVVARTSGPATGTPSPDGSAGGGAALPSPSTPTPTMPPGSPTIAPAPTPTATAAASPSARPTPTPAASMRTYKVRSGDTLSGIAAQFDTTVKKIKVANGLTSNTLRVGQVLLIP